MRRAPRQCTRAVRFSSNVQCVKCPTGQLSECSMRQMSNVSIVRWCNASNVQLRDLFLSNLSASICPMFPIVRRKSCPCQLVSMIKLGQFLLQFRRCLLYLHLRHRSSFLSSLVHCAIPSNCAALVDRLGPNSSLVSSRQMRLASSKSIRCRPVSMARSVPLVLKMGKLARKENRNVEDIPENGTLVRKSECFGHSPKNGNLVRKSECFGQMDIEKVSEFAREEVDSSRLSETVYINGLPWKIWAQIKKKRKALTIMRNGLAFIFCAPLLKKVQQINCQLMLMICDDYAHEDLEWRCFVRSATFRIVSQKNREKNSTGILIDRVFGNKSYNSRGFDNFISFAKLMDPSTGFYNREEDKITLVIDVTVKDEKTEKFVSDPNKSNGIISMEIEKVSEFAREVIKSERESESVHIKGFSWKIVAQIYKKDHSTDNEKWLDIFLLCDASKEAENWSCKCSAIIRIVSQKCGVADFELELNDDVFDNKINSWGYNFISFVELMDPEKGFYDQSEDKVKLAIDFTVKEAKTGDKLINLQFSD
ncbi:hypothetical protein niasHS_015522 [Heterodera schachtii]|uniref:MATH domain-containing protein n=1 Tax=Heterodera schachtii TaxID=97005 RepID=A0ABD2HUC0_HETSC